MLSLSPPPFLFYFYFYSFIYFLGRVYPVDDNNASYYQSLPCLTNSPCNYSVTCRFSNHVADGIFAARLNAKDVAGNAINNWNQEYTPGTRFNISGGSNGQWVVCGCLPSLSPPPTSPAILASVSSCSNSGHSNFNLVLFLLFLFLFLF